MLANMVKAVENVDPQQQFREKNNMSQRCILDSLLSQPSHTRPSELMRTAYNDGSQLSKLHYNENSMNLKSILLEHCYARPYNWRPDANFLRPTKTLFIGQPDKKKKKRALNEAIVDVETIPADAPVGYDTNKARRLMDECDRHIHGIRDNPEDDEWEEKVPKMNWSNIQHTMFNNMVGILNSDRMARLAYAERQNEAVLRRTVVEKSVKRYRMMMSKFAWDLKLVQWLHSVMIDFLTAPYLSAYLDILQTLRYKAPHCFDKVMSSQSAANKYGALSPESLNQLLKRAWDPVATSLAQEKTKKLPGNPIIVVVPSATTMAMNIHSKRFNRWVNLLGNIATVVTVHNNSMYGKKMTMMSCVDQMLASTRSRIQEVKSEYPNKPIIVIGFNSGAALALQVAQVESVLCTISLGFSIYTLEGMRGDQEDNLLELQSPVLFVIGQHAATVYRENMEDIRERMRVETGLLVVGGADDYLRVSTKVKRREGITQSLADRAIVDEIVEFVSGLLLSPYPPQIRQIAGAQPEIKRPKMERKRHNSNGSSLDSEPPSPTPRIGRPVGRPPGSKSKSKIEAKWQAMQQGINQTPNLNTITPIEKSENTSIHTPTLKGNNNTSDITTASPTITTNAKLQAMGLYPGSGIGMSKGLQTGGVRTIPPNPSKQIKDMHKIAQMANQNFPSSANMVLMPDGRFKAVTGQSMRSTGAVGSSALTKLLTRQFVPGGATSSMPGPSGSSGTLSAPRTTKFISCKKQLQGNRPKPIKKVASYIQTQSLPPPTNLTSQDIMDLPIIFADDNQMLANNTIQPSDIPAAPPAIASNIIKTSNGKFLFLNKQHFTNAQSMQKAGLKRPSPPSKTSMQPVKYTKIILSKASEEVKRQALSKMHAVHDIPMHIDLDTELVTKKMIDTANSASTSFKTEIGSYRTEATTSTIVANKIKQAIEDLGEDAELADEVNQSA